MVDCLHLSVRGATDNNLLFKSSAEVSEPDNTSSNLGESIGLPLRSKLHLTDGLELVVPLFLSIRLLGLLRFKCSASKRISSSERQVDVVAEDDAVFAFAKHALRGLIYLDSQKWLSTLVSAEFFVVDAEDFFEHFLVDRRENCFEALELFIEVDDFLVLRDRVVCVVRLNLRFLQGVLLLIGDLDLKLDHSTE